MLVRFLGSAAVGNLLVMAMIGFILYIDTSQRTIRLLLIGIGVAWWGAFYLGCFLLLRATTSKPWNRYQIFGGGFVLALCIAFFVYATVSISGDETLFLLGLFGAASLVIAAIGYAAGKVFRSASGAGLKCGAENDQGATSSTTKE